VVELIYCRRLAWLLGELLHFRCGLGSSSGGHHFLSLMQRNLPFGASFVDTRGAFVKFAAVSVEFLPTKSSG
jgi:hypothetical protein